ncbi:hypothetical protein Tco_0778433 [Tanacetum coccineum]
MGSIWGGGTSGVIVYRYDGFPIHPVPQDEDEREPRFVEVHDTDFVPEHAFPAEEQPLPPVDSPTADGFNPLDHSFRALSTLRRSGLRTARATAKPYQGHSSEFYLITSRILTVAAAGQKHVNSHPQAHTS